MNQTDCTDVYDFVLGALGALGFEFTDNPDHEDVLEALGKVKFVLLHPGDKEKTWPLWDLTMETIEAVAKEKGLSIIGKDPDEIARLTKKGIDAALDFVWEEAIENAIKGTEAVTEDIYNMIEKNKIIHLEGTKPKKHKIVSPDTSDLG